MLTLTSVSKAYGVRPLFRDVSFQLVAGRRTALIGANGSGKTTLLEIVLGRTQPDDGTVTRVRDLTFGYLPQDVDDVGHGTVLERVLEGAAHLTDLERRLRDLEHQIALAHGPDRERLLEVYGHEQDRFDLLGGYGIEAEAHRVLAGLGFAPDDAARPVAELSGGWRVRLALARLLLADPDLLVLDEPTNHLDLTSLRWLEDTLAATPSAVLFVSHDRDFLDAIANRVVELAHGTATEYVGGFADFVEQREQRLTQIAAAAANQQRQIERTERFIERFRYKASKARQVQSRIKSLDRMERVEVPQDRDPKLRFAFPPPRRSGRVVAELRDATVGFGGPPVLQHADVVLERGMKVGLVGPNGAGKTTLLRLLVGGLRPDRGEATLGAGVDVAYFAQHQVEALRQDRRVIEEFTAALGEEHRGRNPRTLLGAFGFGGDAADREVRALSGGEQTRLALARLMATSANLLCLDEPTNHLDIASRSLLEDALAAYPGTVVLITHDRHVLRNTVDHVLEVRDGRVRLHAGGYEEFVAAAGPQDPGTAAPGDDGARRAGAGTPSRASRGAVRGGVAGLPAAAAADRASADKRREAERRNALYRATRDLRKEVARVEQQLEDAEAEVARLTRALADPGVYDRPEHVKGLVAQHGTAKDRAGELMGRWEEAQLALESAESEVEQRFAREGASS